MRFFRSGHFGKRKGGHGGANDSIGSSISERDQFDIIVRHKNKASNASKGWNFLERDDTTVSSITTVEELFYLQQQRKLREAEDQAASKAGTSDPGLGKSYLSESSSWCCCTSSTTTNATAADTVNSNSLLSSKQWSTKQANTVSKKQDEEPLETSAMWSCCSGISDLPAVNGVYGGKNIKKDETSMQLNRDNSLFDALSDEEDGIAGTDSELKAYKKGRRLRKSLKKVLSWNKLNNATSPQ